MPSCARPVSQILHQLIDHRGLEDAGKLLASLTPEQLSAILDLDVWHSRQAGADEELDVARFGAVLTAMEEAHRDEFHEVMRGCRRLSNADSLTR